MSINPLICSNDKGSISKSFFLSNGIKKDYSGKNPVLRDLHERYKVPLRKLPMTERLKNRLKLSFFLTALKYLQARAWGHVKFYQRGMHGKGT